MQVNESESDSPSESFLPGFDNPEKNVAEEFYFVVVVAGLFCFVFKFSQEFLRSQMNPAWRRWGMGSRLLTK